MATEPFATLLVEAHWARGRLVREYTVLLDPPVFTGDKASAGCGRGRAASAPQARSGNVEQPAAAAETEAAPGRRERARAARQRLPRRRMPACGGAANSYTVQRGDTLSADRGATLSRTPQRERALVALYQANPAAFDGNMNVLRTGATLQLPDEASVAAIVSGEAKSEVSRQYRAWAGSARRGRWPACIWCPRPSRGAGRRRATRAAGETAALQQRVTTLQGQLAESQRLLELKNAELARLQQQLHAGSRGPRPHRPAAGPLRAIPPAGRAGAAQGNAYRRSQKRRRPAPAAAAHAAAAKHAPPRRRRARGPRPGRLAGLELVRAAGCAAGADGGGVLACANSRRAGNRISAARSIGLPTPPFEPAATPTGRNAADAHAAEQAGFVVRRRGIRHPSGAAHRRRRICPAARRFRSPLTTRFRQRHRGRARSGRSAGRSGLPHGLWPVRPGRRSGAHRDIARATSPRLEAQAAGSVLRLGQQGPVPATRARTVGEP